MYKFVFFAVLLSLFLFPHLAHGETIRQTLEGGMDLAITYPDSVISGRSFTVSIFIQNNGWEDKQDISLKLTSQVESIEAKNNTLAVDRLSTGGSYGATMTFLTKEDLQAGTQFLNALYSHVLLVNNENPSPPTVRNIAIPILIKDEPQIQLNTVTPSVIFPNAEFPFDVEIVSSDMDITDVEVQVISPEDVTFRGQTTHTFSSIQENVPVQIRLQMITSPEEVTSEHKIPFEIIMNYADDRGEEKTTSKTVPLLLRPRAFMEFTTDGGVWIGGFFLAPYVSIGTLVGIPAGTLFSILVHRLQKKKKKQKKEKQVKQ